MPEYECGDAGTIANMNHPEPDLAVDEAAGAPSSKSIGSDRSDSNGGQEVKRKPAIAAGRVYHDIAQSPPQSRPVDRFDIDRDSNGAGRAHEGGSALTASRQISGSPSRTMRSAPRFSMRRPASSTRSSSVHSSLPW